MTRRTAAKKAAATTKAAPAKKAAPAPAQPSAPAPALELPDAPPLDVAELVADCQAQRDRLLRDVYSLNAEQLEHLAYCQRVLETHAASS